MKFWISARWRTLAKRLWAKMFPLSVKCWPTPVKIVSGCAAALKNAARGKTVPVLIQSGWFDDNGKGTTEALDLTAGYPPGTRKEVVLRPLGSKQRQQQVRPARLSFPPEHCGFGSGSAVSEMVRPLPAGEVKNGVEQSAPVEYYTMGENRWKTASRWPVENADDTIRLFFMKNGTLFPPLRGREGRTGYTYDPQDPGTHIIDTSGNEIAVPGGLHPRGAASGLYVLPHPRCLRRLR